MSSAWIRFGRSAPKLPLLIAGLVVAVFVLTRAGLAVFTGIEQLPLTLWPVVFAKGLWFDLIVAACLIAPICVYEALLPDRWRASRAHGVLRLGWLWLAIALLLFGAVAEATFWLEFSTRFNFIAVDYLLYTQEVIRNVRQSYPVPWILAGVGLAAAIVTWFMRRAVRRQDLIPLTRRQRVALLSAAVAMPALALPLGSVEQMEIPGNAYASELSGNGLFAFAAAMRRNELDYDKFYRVIDQGRADSILARLGVERRPLSEALRPARLDDAATDEVPFARRPRNIVLVSVESLSASFLGAYGSNAGLTPNLDALARDGLKFERVFATGTRTVRGLEALSLGTPPVPGQAIVRRPSNEHLATLGEILAPQGMSAYFFYGGYGYFDNMNAYFGANRYKVIDRTDVPDRSVVFENAWGVADETLFNHAIEILDADQARGRPFFAHIMTTSNHRPFTYPQGRIDIPSPGGRDGAVKYSDFAIGKFIRDARTRPWFDETLFVIVADHCASVAGKTRLPVANYHIPLIFYAPALLKPGTFAPMMSQIDLAPTLVEVLGKQGDDHFFGRSVFEDGPPLERAFISNYQELGYLRDGILTVLHPRKRAESFRVDPQTLASTPIPVDGRLLDEAIAYYQTASRAFRRGALSGPAAP
jgi:phosphoglycerol transferase MdoB-like AlkP superfamily enzyme